MQTELFLHLFLILAQYQGNLKAFDPSIMCDFLAKCLGKLCLLHYQLTAWNNWCQTFCFLHFTVGVKSVWGPDVSQLGLAFGIGMSFQLKVHTLNRKCPHPAQSAKWCESGSSILHFKFYSSTKMIWAEQIAPEAHVFLWDILYSFLIAPDEQVSPWMWCILNLN